MNDKLFEILMRVRTYISTVLNVVKDGMNWKDAYDKELKIEKSNIEYINMLVKNGTIRK